MDDAAVLEPLCTRQFPGRSFGDCGIGRYAAVFFIVLKLVCENVRAPPRGPAQNPGPTPPHPTGTAHVSASTATQREAPARFTHRARMEKGCDG